jgi:G3E family GTPase
MLLDSGCLCCLDSGALHETLADLIAQRSRGAIPAFSNIVIETSGAADPAPLINTLLGHPLVRPHFRLAATVVTVDAQHCSDNLARVPEVARQIALADRLVLTRSDLTDTAHRQAARAQASALNPEAPWWTSPPLPSALAVFEDDGGTAGLRVVPRPSGEPPVARLEPHSIAPLHSSDRRIRSLSLRPSGPITWAGWAGWSRLLLQRMGDRLLRVKGLLQMSESGEIVCVQIVQRVIHRPVRISDWPSEDQSNRLVVIGIDLTESDLEASLHAFELAAGTPTEHVAPHPNF